MQKVFSISLVLATAAVLSFSVPVQASDQDDRIDSSAKQSYVFKNYLKDDDIKIKAKDGVVTLTGTVSEESHRSLAADTVAGLPDVKSVDNKLEVKGGKDGERSDAWLGTKVKTTLLYHRSVSGLQTEVDVKDGVVTLRGEANDQAQKELTGEYAMDIEGVKSVKNEMTISKTTNDSQKSRDKGIVDKSAGAQATGYRLASDKPAADRSMGDKSAADRSMDKSNADRSMDKSNADKSMDKSNADKSMDKSNADKSMGDKSASDRSMGDKIDDASITALVKTTLLSHRSTSGLKTKVETKNGVVTLTGKAKNAAERDLATKRAKDVNGVDDVNNRMTIE